MENLQEMKTILNRAKEESYQVPLSWLSVLVGSAITNLRAHGGIPI
jgi:hypothetical protein